MGNICFGAERKAFNWKIQRFSSLLTLGDVLHKSEAFEAGGYRWQLSLQTTKTNADGKDCISLYLALADASSLPSDEVIKADYKLMIYDLLQGKHIENRGKDTFHTTDSCRGFHYMILTDTFKTPSSGFLVNDTCLFGVEFLELHAHTLDFKGVFDCWSLRKETISHTHTWKIENFAKLRRPYDLSGVFVVGDLKWRIQLYPDGMDNNNHVSIFLILDDSRNLVKNGAYVNFSLCVMDQMNGKHKKNNDGHIFKSKYNSSGWWEFLSHEDLNNPSNGFLVNDACIVVEAMVVVVGDQSTCSR